MCGRRYDSQGLVRSNGRGICCRKGRLNLWRTLEFHFVAQGDRFDCHDPPFGGYTAVPCTVTFSTSHTRSHALWESKARSSIGRDFDRNIKTKGRQLMYVPSVVERVRVKGSDEIFLVTRIDRQNENAHLIPLRGSNDDQIDVPFAEIFPPVFPKRRKKNI